MKDKKQLKAHDQGPPKEEPRTYKDGGPRPSLADIKERLYERFKEDEKANFRFIYSDWANSPYGPGDFSRHYYSKDVRGVPYDDYYPFDPVPGPASSESQKSYTHTWNTYDGTRTSGNVEFEPRGKSIFEQAYNAKPKQWTIQFWGKISFNDPDTKQLIVCSFGYEYEPLFGGGQAFLGHMAMFVNNRPSKSVYFGDPLDIYNKQQELLNLVTHAGAKPVMDEIQEVPATIQEGL